MADPSSKASLRRHYKTLRRQISQQRRNEAAACIMTTLFPDLAAFHRILSFASFNGEIDLWQLNEMLAKEGRLYLPKMDDQQIIPYHVTDIDTQLLKSKNGVLEPNPSKCSKLDPHQLDCILVPGLCFDSKHFRLGYGLGHFDRFLKNLTTISKLGIGFKEQWIFELPVEPHDVVLTKIYLF